MRDWVKDMWGVAQARAGGAREAVGGALVALGVGRREIERERFARAQELGRAACASLEAADVEVAAQAGWIPEPDVVEDFLRRALSQGRFEGAAAMWGRRSEAFVDGEALGALISSGSDDWARRILNQSEDLALRGGKNGEGERLVDGIAARWRADREAGLLWARNCARLVRCAKSAGEVAHAASRDGPREGWEEIGGILMAHAEDYIRAGAALESLCAWRAMTGREPDMAFVRQLASRCGAKELGLVAAEVPAWGALPARGGASAEPPNVELHATRLAQLALDAWFARLNAPSGGSEPWDGLARARFAAAMAAAPKEVARAALEERVKSWAAQGRGDNGWPKGQAAEEIEELLAASVDDVDEASAWLDSVGLSRWSWAAVFPRHAARLEAREIERAVRGSLGEVAIGARRRASLRV